MPRPQKKKVKLNAESLTELLQTIWSESDEQRSKAIFQYNKQNRDVKDNVDIAQVGKTNNELLKIIDGAIDKRIQVARLVKDFISNTSAPVESTSAGLVNDDTREAIFDMVQKASQGTEYVKSDDTKNPF